MRNGECGIPEFEIVTYVSQGFAGALEFSLPSWIANACAKQIIVYTDCILTTDGTDNTDGNSANPLNPCNPWSSDSVEFRHFFSEPSDDPVVSCRRKITSLTDAYARC
jgi:hypothetical protein